MGFFEIFQGCIYIALCVDMDDERFEVVFHHGGRFERNGSLQYVGDLSILACDSDTWSYFEILGILKEMGYANVKEMWYSVGGGSVLEGRLELLSDDRGACHMVNIATLNYQVHLYVVHRVDEPQVVNMLEYHPIEDGAEVNVQNGSEVQVDVRVSEGPAEEDVGVNEGPVEVDVGVNEGPNFEDVMGSEGPAEVDVGVNEGRAEEDVRVSEGPVEVNVGVNEGPAEEDVRVSEGPAEVNVGVNKGPVEEDVRVSEGPAEVDVEVNEDPTEVDVEVEAEFEESVHEPDGNDFDVSSWDESVGDSFNEEELVDVSIHNEDDPLEDDQVEREVGIDEVDFSVPTAPRSNVEDRGLSDTDWESDSCNSVEYSDSSNTDRDTFGRLGIFSMPKSMQDYKWEVRTYFTEKEEFVEAIRTYGAHNGRKLKIFRNEKRRVCVKCLGANGTCNWYAYCVYRAAQSSWQLRTIINQHNCSREFNIRLMTSKWLSQRL